MTTLQEAIHGGRGVERPFQCEAHDDTHDSASVNIAKMVWYCYACHAAGAADGGKPPTTAALMTMLATPEDLRIYPESYLDLFATPSYWLTRFPAWLCWTAQLGHDPFTGDATFPVRHPNGGLAGLAHRQLEGQPKYLYPSNWSASRVMGTTPVMGNAREPLVLVEGFADALALAEVGIPARPVYGSGLHQPQREILLQQHRGPVIMGFDADEAGEKAAARTSELLADVVAEMHTLTWPEKDPGEMDPGDRLEAVVSVVGEGYRQSWLGAAAALDQAYQRHMELEA